MQLLSEKPAVEYIAGRRAVCARHCGRSALALASLHGSMLVLDVDPLERRLDAHGVGVPVAVFRSGERFSCTAVPWLTFEVDEIFEGLTIPR